MDRESAERAIRHGVIAGYFVAAWLLFMVALALALPEVTALQQVRDPWLLVDVPFYLLLAYLLGRHSRVAGVLMLVSYLYGQYEMAKQAPGIGRLLVTMFFTVLFLRATIGAFAWHRIRRQEDPGYRPASRLVPWLVTPLLVALAGLFALFGLQELRILPPNEVLAGTELRPAQLSKLREYGLIDPGEAVIMIYSAGLLSWLDDGNVLTNRRVISWERIDGEFYYSAVRYDEIVDARIEVRGNTLEPSLLVVEAADDEAIYLIVTREQDGDERFLAALARRWRRVVE